MAGMTIIAKLPNNQYMTVFELVQNNSISSIKFKPSSTPGNIAVERMHGIATIPDATPRGAPFVTWSATGGVKDTIVVSDSTSDAVFVNEALGDGLWRQVETAAGRAYGREVRVVPKDDLKLCVAVGSEGLSRASDVLVTIMDLQKVVEASEVN